MLQSNVIATPAPKLNKTKQVLNPRVKRAYFSMSQTNFNHLSLPAKNKEIMSRLSHLHAQSTKFSAINRFNGTQSV